MKHTAAAIAFAAIAMTFPAQADDKVLVAKFYQDILNAAAAPDLAARANAVLAPNWVSIGGNSGDKTVGDFVKGVGGLGQTVPNLKWDIAEILKDGDRYIVRGRATGTPAKTFFGVEPSGKGFDIMSIDIHTVAGGKIVKSYHVEDWAGALRQLRTP